MDCALWLNRRKIFTAAEIAGNLDVASLRGYLLAGTLIDWLNEHGGKRYAQKLSALSPDDEQLGEKIAEIFGASSAPFKELNGGSDDSSDEHPAPQIPESSFSSLLSSYQIGSAGSYNYAALSSFGSFESLLSAVSSGSYSLSSFGGSYSAEWERLLQLLFGYGSFSTSSFAFGSFNRWEWEWLFRLLYGYGSFSISSFTFGSFNQWEWEWLFQFLYGYGSFSANSFAFGSFSQWQWEWLFRLLSGYGSFSANSFTFGSFSLESLLQMLFTAPSSFGYGSFGSFGALNPHADPSRCFHLDEYDLIMLQTLANCPLDRFGYGIHNI